MTNYALNEEKMFADIADGVAIVINSETGIYYGMNELGSAIFEWLINGASVEDVLKGLLAVDGAPADVEAKLKSFVEELKAKELVIEGANNSKEVVIDEAVAKAENFAIMLSEYNDAQELLLADPIHEVKEDMGWTPEKDSIGYSKEETKEREKKMEE